MEGKERPVGLDKVSTEHFFMIAKKQFNKSLVRQQLAYPVIDR